MSYKHHMNNHWAGCRLLAQTRDHCRNRDVKLFLVPGQFDVVGVSDGTDAWVAPSHVPSIFGVDVKPLLDQIRAGVDVKPVVAMPSRARVRLVADGDTTAQPEGSSRVRVRLQA